MNIDNLLKKTIDAKASDLHLIVGLKPVLRIFGELGFIESEKELTPKDIESMVFSMLAANEKELFLKNHDLDFGYSIKSGERFRVNLHYERGNMGLVARAISDEIPSLEDVGVPEITRQLLDLEQGLILITGPTGCGKSTTLAAMIDYINKNRNASIVTLEDPIEFLFKSEKSVIIQRQLGNDMKSFASGLKHVLRQDPDVVMVGEMRDLETISTTITLAETGHLVLATLHTYSAAQTIGRIIDIFPPHQQNQIRSQLSMTLAAVFSQRLLPKVDGGQIAAREVMINTPAIANLIRENKIAQIRSTIETSAKEGMISMDRELKRMYKEKLISKESAQIHMSNPEILNKIL